MFGVLKRLIPTDEWSPARRVMGGRDVEWWRKLRKGAKLRFGVMPQKIISGNELYVSDIIGYDFGHSRFSSHILQSDKGKMICQLIVANNESEGSYLALSRHLTKDELFSICSEEDIELFKNTENMTQLFVRENIRGFEGWLSMRYSKKISGVRGTRRIGEVDRIFDYTLLVNDDNSRAIEIEHYLGGQCDVYVTVYRPVTDLVNLAFPIIRKPQAGTEKTEPKLEPEVAAMVVKKQSIEQVLDEEAPFKNNKSNLESDKLSCDMKLAAKIIDEAVANDMRLADVVRRVIGLRVNPSEQVSFDFPLSSDEYRMLGERYNLPADSHDAIQARIIADLKGFAGEA